MRTVYYTATTLDGFIAGDDHSLAWLLSRDIDQSGPGGYEPFIGRVGALVMGANTYAWIREHGEEAQPGGDPWPYQVPTWVLTHRDFEGYPGQDIRFTSRPVEELYDEMVAAVDGRDLWVVGGGDVAGQFADLGLLDEVIASVAPVTLGSGAPLLPRHVELRLESVARNGDFAVMTHTVVR